MDTKEIATALSALVLKMLEKAISQPDACVVWNANTSPSILLYEGNGSSYVRDMIHHCDGDTLEAQFESAHQFIDALPTPDEKRMNDFMKCLAKAIEVGRSNGIEVEFLNPLQATMKKLSDNILTDQRSDDGPVRGANLEVTA